jgi:abnormal spindle-like microcephaly-associated protein
MILRSFMLIWLLDRAKITGAVHGCLYKATSVRKNSVSVLHALVSMLVPSIGDVCRVLRHLDYEVSHTQDPLDEVQYHIDNIAVDLRDGILLARLVELLLFKPQNAVNKSVDFDATVTVQLPDLTILESALYDADGGQCPRILSRHLKMPCLSRAQKVFNVEVGVSALHDHGRLGYNGLDVSAEEIVDGHREKTLGLLWSLVSTHGLGQLVDFKELAVDLKRTTVNPSDLETLSQDYTRLSQLQHESLLKRWASAHCAQNGLRISNLTTSFADGKAYATILDTFADYMHIKAKDNTSSPNSGRQRLASQLHAFGCSKAFIKQLVLANGTIPSRNTTISNLAFLASRLLPLARQHNAALIIQRAFRCKRLRTTVSQRIALMRLAHACATVVQTQNRLISAATVLQRSWRQVLDARIKKLSRDVDMFQAIAKGWLGRSKFRRERSGLSFGSQALRVMGGW